MKENTQTFSIQATNMIKGFAVCLLVYFHTVTFADPATHTILFPAFYSVFTKYGNVCVIFFVILSAYGYTVQEMNSLQEWNRHNVIVKTIRRLVSLYKGYWPIFLLALILTPILSPGYMDFRIVYQSSSAFKAVLKGLINFFGLSHLFFGDFHYTLNQTWWYLSVAVLLILIIPFQIRAVEKKPLLTSAVLVVLVALFPGIKYIQYLISTLIGILCARYHVFERIHQKKSLLDSILKILTAAIVFIFWVSVRGSVTLSIYSAVADSVFATVMISFLFDFIYPLTPVQKLFSWLGRYSADIFYTHSFVCNYFPVLAVFVYSFQYDLNVWLITLLIALGASILIEFLKKVLHWNDLFKKILLYIH